MPMSQKQQKPCTCLGVARRVVLAAGTGESAVSRLNAFDNALVVAGIHDCNLIPVSSILAKGTRIVEQFCIVPGAFVPAVLSVAHGERGKRLCTGLAVGFNDKGYGYVVEGQGTRPSSLRIRLEKQLAEMAAVRGQRILRSHMKIAEAAVSKRYGSCVAACVYLF